MPSSTSGFSMHHASPSAASGSRPQICTSAPWPYCASRFLSSTVLELFAAIGVAMVAVYVGFVLLGELDFGSWGGTLTIGEGVFLLMLAPEYFQPLRDLASAWHDKAAARAVAGELHELSQQQQQRILGNGDFSPSTEIGKTLLKTQNLSWHGPGGQRLVFPDIDIQSRTIDCHYRVPVVQVNPPGSACLQAWSNPPPAVITAAGEALESGRTPMPGVRTSAGCRRRHGSLAFFLEATFVGLFFFGWDKLSRIKHLMVAWLVALGSNFSALWILIANGWMQHPVGSEFNPVTMRMELTSFFEVVFNEVAQAKFVHTVSAGYVTASVFVMGVSAYYLLRNRHVDLARRSIAIAASFGLASALSVVVLGDESGYNAGHSQKMKLAAIEAMWETEPAPASFTLFGIPDSEARETHYAVHIPWAMGLIGTRSFDQVIPGINELEAESEERIRSGILAYDALLGIREQHGNVSPEVTAKFEQYGGDLGYAYLLMRYVEDPRDASEADIKSWLQPIPFQEWGRCSGPFV